MQYLRILIFKETQTSSSSSKLSAASIRFFVDEWVGVRRQPRHSRIILQQSASRVDDQIDESVQPSFCRPKPRLRRQSASLHSLLQQVSVTDRRTVGRTTMKSTRRVLGHSLFRSFARSLTHSDPERVMPMKTMRLFHTVLAHCETGLQQVSLRLQRKF